MARGRTAVRCTLKHTTVLVNLCIASPGSKVILGESVKACPITRTEVVNMKPQCGVLYIEKYACACFNTQVLMCSFYCTGALMVCELLSTLTGAIKRAC